MPTLACAHINISPFFHENLSSVKWQYDSIPIHWLMFTWEKSNSKNWQATPSEKADCNSCTSTNLLSCPWLRMSSSLGFCTTSDLQANSEGGREKTGGREDRRWMGGKDNKPTQFTITFQTHLISLNHSKPFQLSLDLLVHTYLSVLTRSPKFWNQRGLQTPCKTLR